ncbi:hypothetical protein BDW68DRAFT_169233 [Aspergillus falconensis]
MLTLDAAVTASVCWHSSAAACPLYILLDPCPISIQHRIPYISSTVGIEAMRIHHAEPPPRKVRFVVWADRCPQDRSVSCLSLRSARMAMLR